MLGASIKIYRVETEFHDDARDVSSAHHLMARFVFISRILRLAPLPAHVDSRSGVIRVRSRRQPTMLLDEDLERTRCSFVIGTYGLCTLTCFFVAGHVRVRSEGSKYVRTRCGPRHRSSREGYPRHNHARQLLWLALCFSPLESVRLPVAHPARGSQSSSIRILPSKQWHGVLSGAIPL